MPLVPAKCTQCGSNLEIDSSKEAAICPFCNTPFITEKAINNYNTTNVTNIGNLHADVVNVSEDNSRENRVLSGETFIKLGDYGKAEKVFTELTNDFPHDYRGWWGLIKVNSRNFTDFSIGRAIYNKISNLFEKLKTVADTTSLNEIVDTYNTYMVQCNMKLSDVENKNKTELSRISERLNQLDELEKQETERLLSQHQNKIDSLKGQIALYNGKSESAIKGGKTFGWILAILVVVISIAAFADSSSASAKFAAIIGAPLVFGAMAYGICFVYNLIIVTPIVASNGKNVKALNEELKSLQAQYNSNLRQIETKYKSEREEIDKEKSKINEIVRLYS